MNLGIVGSGGIVNTCLDAVQKIVDLHCVAICVRKQSINKGEKLQTAFNIDKIYTEYTDLIHDGNIDVIYIGLPNHLHFQYVKEALLANKNVVCEKPFTSNAQQLEELIQLAQREKCFLFEAITTKYSPSMSVVKQYLPKIGAIKLVHSNYSQYSSRYHAYLDGKVAPVFDPKMSGGALMDINIYNIHLNLLLLGMPMQVYYIENKGFNGVDTSGVLVMQYPQWVSVCMGAKDCDGLNQTLIQGEKGQILIHGPANDIDSVELILPEEKQHLVADKCENRMVEEWLFFIDCIVKKNTAACDAALQHSMRVMCVLDMARQEKG